MNEIIGHSSYFNTYRSANYVANESQVMSIIKYDIKESSMRDESREVTKYIRREIISNFAVTHSVLSSNNLSSVLSYADGIDMLRKERYFSTDSKIIPYYVLDKILQSWIVRNILFIDDLCIIRDTSGTLSIIDIDMMREKDVRIINLRNYKLTGVISYVTLYDYIMKMSKRYRVRREDLKSLESNEVVRDILSHIS
jgi:hypothetical protein